MILMFSSFFFFYCSGAHRDLHSFPTRRSSDLQPSRHLALRVVAELGQQLLLLREQPLGAAVEDRKSTRLNSSHVSISYAVFCLKKKKTTSKIESVTTRLNAHLSVNTTTNFIML